MESARIAASSTKDIARRRGNTAGQNAETLARLRSEIGRLEGDVAQFGGEDGPPRVELGHREADATLQGGLLRGALHEVFAGGAQAATATGFIAALAWRVAVQRPLLWVRQDFSERENGALAMSGWCELGLDPCALVMVHAPDSEVALQIASDALACEALGAVVTEIWGETRHFDLVASRKLTLAARDSGVTGLLLRIAAKPAPSTAETRWVLRAAPSRPHTSWQAWGAPVFDAQLVRNRHGQHGQWIMEWNCDECLFREVPLRRAAADSQPLAAAPAHRPHPAATVAPWRRTG